MADAKFAVSVRGFAEIQRAVRRMGGETPARLRQKLREIGDTVALVEASDAPRLTGELQTSFKVSTTLRGASVYSATPYGGAVNYGAWVKHGRGPHIRRADASHYAQRAVLETQPFVESEVNSLLDWLMKTFEEGG